MEFVEDWKRNMSLDQKDWNGVDFSASLRTSEYDCVQDSVRVVFPGSINICEVSVPLSVEVGDPK